MPKASGFGTFLLGLRADEMGPRGQRRPGARANYGFRLTLAEEAELERAEATQESSTRCLEIHHRASQRLRRMLRRQRQRSHVRDPVHRPYRGTRPPIAKLIQPGAARSRMPLLAPSYPETSSVDDRVNFRTAICSRTRASSSSSSSSDEQSSELVVEVSTELSDAQSLLAARYSRECQKSQVLKSNRASLKTNGTDPGTHTFDAQ